LASRWGRRFWLFVSDFHFTSSIMAMEGRSRRFPAVQSHLEQFIGLPSRFLRPREQY